MQKVETKKSQAGWFMLIILCMVQIGTTCDTSILANAMSALAHAFHASIAQIQLANIIYPLVTGALMILGGVLGIRIGWKRLLIIGNLILALGELVAYFSPTMVVFTFVARVLVGIGASLAIPATIGIVMVVYKGQMRAIAFASLAAANGIASALGPILGGWIIVAANWRDNYIWLTALFILLFVLLFFQRNVKIPGRPIKIDISGSILIIIGLSLFTYGLAKVSSWGAFKPLAAPFTIFGLSPSPFFIIAGILFIWFFSLYESYKERKKQAVILPQIFIKNKASRSGLYMNALVFIILGGVMFALITFLQIVLNYNAIETGLFLLCFAVGITLFSIGTPVAWPKASPRTICRIGIIISAIACFLIALGLERTGINIWFLVIGLFISGAGVGLLSSQASNVIAEAVPEDLAEVSSGVQGATRNVGNAIGIALIGLVLIMALTASVKGTVKHSNIIPPTAKYRVSIVKDVPFMSTPQLEASLKKLNTPTKLAENYVKINLRSRVVAIRTTLLVLAIIILFGLFGTKGLPNRKGPTVKAPGSDL
jgi:MFS family permease